MKLYFALRRVVRLLRCYSGEAEWRVGRYTIWVEKEGA